MSWGSKLIKSLNKEMEDWGKCGINAETIFQYPIEGIGHKEGMIIRWRFMCAGPIVPEVPKGYLCELSIDPKFAAFNVMKILKKGGKSTEADAAKSELVLTRDGVKGGFEKVTDGSNERTEIITNMYLLPSKKANSYGREVFCRAIFSHLLAMRNLSGGRKREDEELR